MIDAFRLQNAVLLQLATTPLPPGILPHDAVRACLGTHGLTAALTYACPPEIPPLPSFALSPRRPVELHVHLHVTGGDDGATGE